MKLTNYSVKCILLGAGREVCSHFDAPSLIWLHSLHLYLIGPFLFSSLEKQKHKHHISVELVEIVSINVLSKETL